MSDPLTMLAELRAEVFDLRARIEELERERSPKRLLTVAETGEHLGCSEGAVYERISKGRIPACAVKRTGRRIYIDRQALDDSLLEV